MSYANEILRELYYLRAFGYKFADFSPSSMALPRSLAELNASIKECNLCELCKSANHVLTGLGDKNAKVVFVFDAPNAAEDASGEFLASDDKFLQNLNELAGLKKDEIYVTSLLKCKPAAKVPTNAYELCEPYFSAEARLVAPKLIVALGEEVFYKIIKQSAQSFETIRGNIMKFKHSALLATYSPAVVAKNPSKKELFFSDLRKIKEYL